jgi:hypothetical protein
MYVTDHLPNGQLLLNTLRLSPDRLNAGIKAAIPLSALRAFLCAILASTRFDQEFYLETYPDLRSSFEAGNIADLRRHFIEVGYFEGRLGARPEFDEKYYLESYPDVAIAIASGSVRSALDHYVRAGAIEGRFASAADMEAVTRWRSLLTAKTS